MAKTLWSFDHSECNEVNDDNIVAEQQTFSRLTEKVHKYGICKEFRMQVQPDHSIPYLQIFMNLYTVLLLLKAIYMYK